MRVYIKLMDEKKLYKILISCCEVELFKFYNMNKFMFQEKKLYIKSVL